jgi:transposase-like protein
MARQKGSRTGHCQGCNHVERARIERLLAAGASIKGTARKFDIDYHALRRHWINHVCQSPAPHTLQAAVRPRSARSNRRGRVSRVGRLLPDCA